MQLTSRQNFAADPVTVVDMLCNQEFLEQLCQSTAATSHSVAVDGRTATLNLALPTPSAIASLVGATLNVVEVTTWSEPSSDGTIPGTISVRVNGFPVELDGTALASATDVGTVIDYNSTLTVKIPFMGSRVEQLAAPQIMEALAGQQEISNAWLAAHPR